MAPHRNIDWWQGFFSGLWLEVQRGMWPAEQTAAEANFIEKLLQPPPGARILDVPCGEGRLSIELASRGYRLTGVDFTPPLLADARRKAAERKLKIVWEKRDMRDLPWREGFDGSFCFWTSFGYFDEKGNLAFLKAVSRALKPGAKFILHTNGMIESLLPNFRSRGWRQVGDVFVLEERRYNQVEQKIEAELILIKGSRKEKKFSSIRMYSYREICHLFAAAGFENFQGYASLGGEPFRLGSPALYFVATKSNN